MSDHEPTSESPYSADETAVTPWAEAREELGRGRTYWLATVRDDGVPHLMPLLSVNVDGAMHFCAGAGTRKARNLARDPHCVIATGGEALDVVVEGTAARVEDEGRLNRVAEAYGSKYDWHPEVRDGALWEEGAPTAGPPPYDVYEVVPSKAFGFPGDEERSPTRWRF